MFYKYNSTAKEYISENSTAYYSFDDSRYLDQTMNDFA